MNHDDPDFACDMTEITSVERERHEAIGRELFTSAEALREEPDGYRFRLPASAETIRDAGAFISREQRCCPFLDFTLEVSGGEGPVWLALTGPPGVREYLEENLVSQLEDL